MTLPALALKPRRRAQLTVALAATTIALVILCSPKRIVDDTFISLRASFHLIHGDGPVFNLHERVEAFSNLLWTVLMALPIGLGLSPAYAAAYGGIALGIGATTRAAHHTARHGGSPTIALGLVALCPSFWSMTAIGLEGGLYALLLVEVYGALLDRRTMRLGILGGLLFMTRVESILLLVPVLAVLAFVDDPRDRSAEPTRASMLRTAGPWAGIAIVVTLARLAYFGDVVPNSVRAKSSALSDVTALVDNLGPGLRYLRGSLPAIGAVLVLPLVGVARRRTLAATFGVAAFAVAAAVAVRNGGDWMSHFRLLTPYVPLLASSSGIVAATLWRSRTTLRPAVQRITTAALVAALTGLCATALAHNHWASPTLAIKLPYQENRDLAVALRDHLVPGDIVTVEALGYFSYYAPDAYVHDFLGLADRHIAESGKLSPPWGRLDYRYTIDEVKPTVILLHSGYGHFLQMIAVSSQDLSTVYRLYALCPIADLRRPFFF
ncbi:MAG: hypothetical protein F2789_15425, partial [Actinobacteria bacterium]|nr:hypothetical protein [Actinomycetota bacterium]